MGRAKHRETMEFEVILRRVLVLGFGCEKAGLAWSSPAIWLVYGLDIQLHLAVVCITQVKRCRCLAVSDEGMIVW